MPNTTEPGTNLHAQTLYLREACKQFARQNLPALCGEIVQWKDTTILPDQALLRKLGRLVFEWAPHDSLIIAKTIVVAEALTVVSKMRELSLDVQDPVVSEGTSAKPEDLLRQRP